jgi:hypothetical protein
MRYNISEAMATLALMPADAEDKDLLWVLHSLTTIPEDRVQVCLDEFKPQLPQLRMLAAMAGMLAGEEPTSQMLSETFADSWWLDDGKTDTHLGLTVLDEDGNEVVSASIDRKGP